MKKKHGARSCRKSARSSSAENCRPLQAVFDNAMDIILLVDDQGGYVDANPAACAFLGYRREELLQLRMWDTTPIANRECVREMWRQLIAGGRLKGEAVVLRKDGSSANTEFQAVANLLPGLHMFICRDVTERKRLEEKARHLEILSRSIQEINRVLDPCTIIRSLTLAGQELVRAQAGAWGLVTEERIVLAEYLRQGEATRIDVSFEPSVGVPGWVMVNKVPYVSNDPANDPQVSRRLHQRFGFYNLISIPVLDCRGSVLGCFQLYNKAGRQPYNESDILRLQGLASSASVALCHSAMLVEQKRVEEALRELSGRLVNVQDKERRRIARELHDGTAQTLAAVGINIAVINEFAPKLEEKARKAIAESLRLIENCVSEVRTISYLLHPPLLEELGLTAALEWYVKGLTQRSGIQVNMDVAPELGRLPEEIELTLYRIVQESLTNILRHSGSSTASIRLALERQEVALTLTDQGCGIPRDLLGRLDREGGGSGVGIAGMRERVRQLSGRFQVKSSKRGTTITVFLPAQVPRPRATSEMEETTLELACRSLATQEPRPRATAQAAVEADDR